MDNEVTKAVYVTQKEKTFCHDETLPNLPVPDLCETLTKYIESVKPLADESQLKKTKEVVKNFQQGVGKQLQAMLLLKAKNEKNWLKTWWENYAYLTLREPLLPYYSMAGSLGLEAVPWPKGSTMLQQAALYTYFLLEFWKLIVDERLSPTKNVEGKYFNMEQFKQLFNTSRKPGIFKDDIVSYFETGTECPSHVVIMCKGHFYVVDSMCGHEGILTAAEWEHQLNYVCSASENETPSIATLTTDNRTNWAKNREWLNIISHNNLDVLHCIDSAILLLVLDETMPGSEEAALHQTLNADCSKRWLDKSLSIIFFKDGTIGALCDWWQRQLCAFHKLGWLHSKWRLCSTYV